MGRPGADLIVDHGMNFSEHRGPEHGDCYWDVGYDGPSNSAAGPGLKSSNIAIYPSQLLVRIQEIPSPLRTIGRDVHQDRSVANSCIQIII